MKVWAWALVVGGGLLLAVRAMASEAKLDLKRYPPGSEEAKALLREALQVAGLPTSWADSPDLHYILKAESKGIVGKPNYTFGPVYLNKNAHRWPSEIWERLRKGDVWTRSTATGLGQLLSSNAKKFYPSGVNGIGVPLEEAVGFVRYIADRYGSPEVARSVYGKVGTYTHAITGAVRTKKFKEGY